MANLFENNFHKIIETYSPWVEAKQRNGSTGEENSQQKERFTPPDIRQSTN